MTFFSFIEFGQYFILNPSDLKRHLKQSAHESDGYNVLIATNSDSIQYTKNIYSQESIITVRQDAMMDGCG